MTSPPLSITSATNARVKRVVKLRQRSHRDELGLLIVEGYREVKRALDNAHAPVELFFCRDLFPGPNEDVLIERCAAAGALLYECTAQVFRKMAYRDRPEGLLAVAPRVERALATLSLRDDALLVVAEAIEKPGNLGTILRSADAAGVQAVLVCDRCTDVNNPNVVRASIGTLFSLPVIEADSASVLAFLKAQGVTVLSASPQADMPYTRAEMTGRTAIVVGAEQYGLSPAWLEQADVLVKIPMLGQADSLNVASATTILLYEAARQRGLLDGAREDPR